MSAVQDRPAFIPDHAQNVTQLSPGLWLWEFSGGAVVYLGHNGGQVVLDTHVLEKVTSHFATHADRYKGAITEEKARRDAYDDYVNGVDYEGDYEDDEL